MNRVYRLYLLLRCLVASLWLGSATRVPQNPSAIIVVPTGKLGDIVCATPVLRAIRAHLPMTRIVVAGVTKLHRPLLSDSGLVDDYLDLGAPKAVARIKKCRAQVALVTGPSFVSAALMYLSGISLVVAARVEGGYSPSETTPYQILKRLITTFPYKMGEYAPRERLRALEPLGVVSHDTKKYLGFSKDADRKVGQFLAGHDINLGKDFVVGISPSAGNKIKEWPEERFAEVAGYLIEKYKAKAILIGGPADAEKVKRTESYMKLKPIQVTNLNIDGLKALVSKLSLFISVDTGPIYIAEAFGVPTIDITGPIDEGEQPPRGPLHRNVVPPDRQKPELSVLNARHYDRDEAMRQVLSITTSAVKNEIDILWSHLQTV